MESFQKIAANSLTRVLTTIRLRLFAKRTCKRFSLFQKGEGRGEGATFAFPVDGKPASAFTHALGP